MLIVASGHCSPRKSEQGLSLVIALFILVVLSMLGAAMINVLSAGSDSVAREVISTRALFAAESGAQKKLNQIFPPGSPVSNTGECSNVTYTAADLGGIVGCSTLSVFIVCNLNPVNGINYFTISSEAHCGPVNEPAVRRVEVQARDGL